MRIPATISPLVERLINIEECLSLANDVDTSRSHSIILLVRIDELINDARRLAELDSKEFAMMFISELELRMNQSQMRLMSLTRSGAK